jgi:glycosidase
LLAQHNHRELFDLYRQLITLRRTTPALHRSSRSQARAWAEGSVITLLRTHEEGDVVILFNVGAAEERVSLPQGSWRDLLDTNESPRTPGVVTVDPWSYRVFSSTVTG